VSISNSRSYGGVSGWDWGLSPKFYLDGSRDRIVSKETRPRAGRTRLRFPDAAEFLTPNTSHTCSGTQKTWNPMSPGSFPADKAARTWHSMSGTILLLNSMPLWHVLDKFSFLSRIPGKLIQNSKTKRTKEHRKTEEEMEGPTSSWGLRNRKHA
jgi:hypothetical protein